jgi:hypothetical protein
MVIKILVLREKNWKKKIGYQNGDQNLITTSS